MLRQGQHTALLAVGSMVQQALEAAQLLSQKSVEVSVINCRFIKPIDETMFRELTRRHDHLFTIEENVLAGGFGAAVLEILEREGLNHVRVSRMGLPDRFIEHGPRDQLLAGLKLDAGGICETVLKELSA
jgi:1-deoxy-D-xylulose-5-phosphate synthase